MHPVVKVSTEAYYNPGHMMDCGQILLQKCDNFSAFKKFCMNAGGSVNFNLCWRFRASAAVAFVIYAIRLNRDVPREELYNVVFEGGKSSYTPWHCLPNVALDMGATNVTSGRGRGSGTHNKDAEKTPEGDFTLFWAYESHPKGASDFVASGYFLARGLPRSTFCREIADNSDVNYLEGDILIFVCPRVKWTYTIPVSALPAEGTTLDVPQAECPDCIRCMYPEAERVYINASLEVFGEENKGGKSVGNRRGGGAAGTKRKRVTTTTVSGNGGNVTKTGVESAFEDYVNALTSGAMASRTRNGGALDVDDDDDVGGDAMETGLGEEDK